ncbi:ESPR-type extended signal peptide-containing protein [Dialister succinatiphilus]|uniref:ESPR-type extended signal peptide-containing protein n=1 Tax=Dialister succinatiphilus TaxID=487173 RepID=UPI0040298F24
MNKIFKVIFSKAKGCYVVVSELAKSAGKGTSASHIQRGYTLTLAAAVLSMMMGMAPVGAADPVDLDHGASAYYDANGNLTIGKNVQAEGKNNTGSNNTVIGTDTDTTRDDGTGNGQALDDVSNTKLVEGEGKEHELNRSTESSGDPDKGSTAVGYDSHAEGDASAAIGNKAVVKNAPTTYYADADGNKTTSQTDAVWYKDSNGKPTKVPQVFRDADNKTTTTPQYIHTYTEKDATTGQTVTKTEITTDATKADKNSDGSLKYSYQKEDNTKHLYSVTLYQPSSNSIAAGSEVEADGENAVAVGYQSTAKSSAVAIGDNANAEKDSVAIGKQATASVEGGVALGMGSTADRDGGVTGWDPKTGTTSTKTDAAWKSGEGALSIGNGGASRQITNVAAGSEDSDAVNLAQLKNAMTHYYSVKTTEATDAAGNNNYLNDGATGNNALAAGVSAVATGDNATAVGTNTYASGTNASAYGYRAVASGSGSVAIGSGTSAQQEGSVAVGGHTQGSHAVQVGTDSTAQSAYSVAVGGHAKGEYSVEVGYGSTAQGSYSTSIGGHAIGKNSIAIGSENQNSYSNPASAGGANSIAIGGHTNSTNDIAIGAGSSTSGGHAIAVGGSATGQQAVSIGGVAGNSQATAVGNGSAATGSQSTAVGGHAGDVYSTAVGQGANATYVYATAVGNSSTASGSYSTALGYGTSAQGSSTTAIGGANANGTNLTVIGKGSTASASSWYDTISNSTAIGGAHISASDAAAIGSNATVNGQYGVALGYNSNVSYQSTGVGTGTKASNTGTAVGYGAQSSGYQSAAVGVGSNATGQNAVSLGGGGAWGDYSIALGSGAGTTAHGIAIGQNSGAWGENAIAIGEGTNAWRANSIVLGKNSKSGADKNIEGYDPRTGVASVDDTSTWYSTDEAVSIGRAEERDDGGNITASAITRQLNNLAAGTLDTDAVNVAQLKAATQKVNMHDYSVWSPDTETDTNYTNGGAIAKNSMAAGVSAGATGENAVAIGYGAKAKGRSATVIGKNASATGQYAMAFGGLDTTDKKGNPVTMTNTASGASATAFGQGAQAKGAASLAFGHNTVAGVDGGGQQSVAFGEDTQALGGRSLAFGEKTIAKYNDSVAFGNDTRASSTGATAFGNRTRALSQYATAWGNATVAADEESTAWGTDTIAGAKLDANGAVTNIYTYKNNPDDKNEQAKTATEQMDVHGNLAYIQPNGKTAGIKQMKIDSGSELHDYVVLAGKDRNTYVRDYQGSLWKVNVDANGTVTVDTTAGTNGKVYNGKNGAKQSLATTTVNGAEVAITPDNVLTKAHEGSNGYNIDGYANATAFGYSTEASGDNATAFGNDTKAAGAGATAFGYKTLASGENATAFGDSSIAAGKNSLAALGGTTTDAATNAAAIGSGAKATLVDSVALGSHSVTTRAKYNDLTGDAEKAAYAKGTSTGSAWEATDNAIAAGNDSTVTRQITGVAAGSLDTDAVNVAQLKAVDARHTTVSVGGQQAQADNAVVKGGNLEMTRTTSNGQANYDVSLNKDIVLGQQEENKGGSIVINSVGTFRESDNHGNHTDYPMKEAVKIDGTTVSVVKHDGDNDQRQVVMGVGQDTGGYVALYDNTGKKPTYIFNAISHGITYLKDKATNPDDANEFGRLEYGDIYHGSTQFIATLDDGLKFSGDQGTMSTVKLNQELSVTGGVTDTNSLSTGSNIGVVSTPDVEDDKGNITQKAKLELKLNKDLTGLNTVTAGTAKIGSSPADTLKLTENGAVTEKAAPAGSYVTGLENKDWDTTNPSYVSGRAATEDQLAKVSEAINNATTAAGKRTVVTVNDKSNPAEATPSATAGAYGDYDSTGGNLMIAAKKDSDGVLTYNIKLNDQLAIGQKGEPGVAGKDGKDGKVTVETKGGTTVVIGHDGEPGKDGKDGLFVTGKDGADGKSGVSITGPNGTAGTDGVDGKVGIAGKDGRDAVSIAGKDGVGHIGLTGPKGADGTPGKDGIFIDITTDLKAPTLDSTKNVSTTVKDASGKETTIEQAPRIQYQSGDNTYEVATMDDGLKFVGNDGKEVAKKLNSTLSLTGGITDGDALKKASSKNLGVRSNKDGDGLEIVMTDTPDFTKVTVGGDTKITIGGQTNSDTKNPANGNYITGLDNTKWDKDHVTENRAATEGQLRDVAGSITNQTKGGGFALTSDEKGDDKIVKQDLGKAIQIKGDTTYKTDGSVEKAGNIKTSIDNGAIKVELNKDVDLGADGSVKAGNTTINNKGVDTNKVKVGDITITDQGINGGAKQITNIASGIDGKRYADAGDNNAASIGDVKQLAQQEAQASAARSGKNITVKDDHTVNLNDDITLGDDPNKQVAIHGSNGQVTIGSGDKTLTLGQQANGAWDNNPATGNFLNGLDNRKWDGEHIQNGRAATEDQLKTVSDKVKSGRVFQGDDGQDVTVGLGDTLKIQGGAKDVSSDNNIGIVKGADDTLNVRLAKDLTGLGSVTTGGTTMNDKGITIKTGDANRTITIQDGNVNMGGNQIHHVAPGQAPDDAVNVSQLNATNYAVNKLDTRVNRVGANAAALAALHPLDFDPDDKWDFSAGYGHYKDANAAAVGAFYRPNEDTMFSVGGSFGGGENMVNAGISVKLGQGNHVSTSRVAMAKEIKDLKKDVAALKAVVNQQSALIDKLTGVNAGELSGSDDLFPDVPANHWAYEYVTRLKQAGILTGYPDGNFAGDRMMTRYEFAAIVYRAIMAGAAANPSLNKDGTLDRLSKEFSSEMKYIRIDTIRKDRNGRPTIQRVRVIKEDEKEK